MSANQLLSLSLLAGVFECLALYGPYIGFGVYPLAVSPAISVGYWFAVKSKGLDSKQSRSYRDFFWLVKWYYNIFIMSLAPLLLFLYYALPVWMKCAGGASLLFCVFGWVKAIKLLEDEQRNSTKRQGPQ